MEMVLTNLSSTRRVTEGDREYLVAPLTLIVPGVLNGSQGSLYYPPEQIQRSVGAWNGIPITLHHPRKDGKLISVKDGGVTLGVLRNAEYRDGLKVEGWFELDSLQGQSPQLVGSIESGEQIELSTGLYTDNRPVKNGEHEGRAYTHVAENYRPDHLAILPDEKGACSVEDGCGVNVNYSASQPRGADGKFGSGGGGGGGGGGTHTVKLPKKKSKINIPQAGEALEEMGYKLGKGKTTQHEGQWTTAYEVTTPSGKTEQWSAGAVKDFVYKNQVNVNAYNPSQPRAADGKFGSGGGSGGGGGKVTGKFKVGSSVTAKAFPGSEGTVQEVESQFTGIGQAGSIYDPKGRGSGAHYKAMYRVEWSKGPLTGLTTPMKGSDLTANVDGERQGILQRLSTLLGELVENLQPHSKNTGRFKKPGQGTGRGDVHESAQMGAFDSTMLSEEDHALGADAYAQAEAGHNPISWVADEAKWQKAKASADKGNHKGATHWAVVTHIYKKMGGGMKAKTKNEDNLLQNEEVQMPLTDNQRTAAVDKLLDCCWEQDDRETLEGLTDNQLTKLVKQTEDNEQLSLVANTAREVLELPEDTTINAMPEALKKAIDAKKKKKSDGGDEEEEEEEEVKKTENQIPLTEEQWREQAPQEVLEDLAFARNERARQKNEAIASVVGNLQGEERSKAEGVLLKLSTDDIRSITPIVPKQKRTANYGTVPPVGNEGDEELPMERRTWDFSPAAA